MRRRGEVGEEVETKIDADIGHDDKGNDELSCHSRLARFVKPFSEIHGHYGLLAKACTLLFVRGFCGYPAEFFMFKVLQDRHGYAPIQVTALTLGGGLISIFAYVSAGRLSDVYGRRPILSVVYVVYFSMLIAFYNADGNFFTVTTWILFAAAMFGLDVLNSALVSEVFPTRCRATATTIVVIINVIGTVAGILVEGCCDY